MALVACMRKLLTIVKALRRDALRAAGVMNRWRRGEPDTLLHHSDRGSQYTGDQFRRLVDELGVTCSMGRSDSCRDNSAMKSFFKSLKTERTDRRVYCTRADAKADVFC